MSWKIVKLGDVITIERNSVQPENIFKNTKYLGLDNIKSGGEILGYELVDKGDLKSSKFVFTSKHILFGKLRPYLAKVSLPNFDGICSTDIIPIIANEKADKRFIAYFLKQEKIVKLASDRSVGVNLPRLSPKELIKFEIPLPPLPEQQRIADILDKAEAITQKREQALTLCDEFLRATFLDMFGDPVSNPKGWEVDKLKNLTSKIGSGSTPRGGKESYLDSGMTLVRSLNIYDNEFVKKGLAFISKAQADKLSNVALEADDILLNITGASVCRCSMMDNSLLPARVNQHVCIIRPNGIDNLFLLHLLISKNYKHKLMTLATSGGATREALTKEDITELGIIVPPIQLQQQFSEIVKRVNAVKARILQAQELPLFDALSQQAFKGELTQ